MVGLVLMDWLEKVGRQFAALPTAQDTATIGRAALDEARHVLREVWRQGIEHRVPLTTLGASGLAALDIPRAGWEPDLLRALDRAVRLIPL
ncbi:hypothetical protein [Streptomyces sp. 7N604]|uniref:hypothetical protein n=1 Tax=Streptomyces sp. 7N604 TaxID=3457415 RepID=UPI003FD52572